MTQRKGKFSSRGQCVFREDREFCHFRSSGYAGVETLVSVGGSTYTSAAQQTLSRGKQWLRIGQGPDKLLPFAPNSTMRKIGDETIAGVPTVHYRYTETITDTTPPGSPTTAPPAHVVIDMWADSHHLIRRLVITSKDFITTLNYSHYGAKFPPITAPPADKVTDNPFPSAAQGDITRVPPPTRQTAPPTTAPTQAPAP
jgi:hypothetical protein